MVVLRRRSRLATLLVSTEEYGALMTVCIDCRARSIAGFARMAVLQKLQSVGIPTGVLNADSHEYRG